MCMAGSGTPTRRCSPEEHSLGKKDIWGGALELLESPDALLPQAQALGTFLDPTLFKNRKAEAEALGVCPSLPQCNSPPPQ